MKRCIFYLPYRLEEKANGARMIRPRKMMQAFREIGYEVFEITGFSAERRQKIRGLKKSIAAGDKYDFMYTEAHTEPTLLTDPHHLPTHPFLDFGFFKYIRKQGIKIGLYYCDIYWKFDTYGVGLPAWKKAAAIRCYKYDIREYERWLNIFYIQELKLIDYTDSKKLKEIGRELPPGADAIEAAPRPERKAGDPLRIFYVGGLSNLYEMEEVVKAVTATPGCELTLCCRKEEWEKEKHKYEPYMCDRIRIVHLNGDQLEGEYAKADLCSLLFRKTEYREMIKPFKALEYLAHEIPMLSTKGTAIGSYVEQNDIGWNVAYNEKSICRALQEILEDPALIAQKRRNCAAVKQQNLWTSRAEQVAKELS